MKSAKPSVKKRKNFGWLIGVAAKSTKLVKMLKLLKVLITPLSMLLSVIVYGWAMGFWFAIGFVLLLFVHEMGHVIAMKIKGYPTKMPLFIPMLGAVIFAPGFNNREDEAFIGYGGPFLGGIGALALFGIWALLPQKSDLLIVLSYVGVFLNLFNMIPISPMDGGRITKIIGKWFVWIGAATLVALVFVLKSPFMFLIGILALSDINMSPKRRFQWAAGFMCAMVAMIALGFSNQGFAMDAVDTALALCFTSLLYWIHNIREQREKKAAEKRKRRADRIVVVNARREARGEPPFVDNMVAEEPAVAVEQPVPAGVRIKWLALYLGLTALFVVGITVQIAHLPAHLSR